MLVRVDVDGVLDRGSTAERREERDPLGAGPPDDRATSAGPQGRELAAPSLDGLPVAVLEVLHRRLELGEVVLEGKGVAVGARRVRWLGLDQQVLVVVGKAEIEDVEAGRAEQAGERAGREVGAVLVVHVPERDLLEHPPDVGQLEEHHGVEPVADRAPDRAQHLRHGLDVLEGVPADDGVGGQERVALGVEVLDPREPVGRGRFDPLRAHAGVDADAVPGALLAHGDQELTLPASDLQHVPAVEVVLLDPRCRQLVGERLEGGRERLRLLVLGRVLVESGIEGRVRDEAARSAEPEVEGAAWESGGLLPAGEQEAAVRGDLRLLVEVPEIGSSTGGTAVEPHDNTSGVGTGTMKRPPRARYSACWRRISSAKFQARSST